jgi:hypothetical protein
MTETLIEPLTVRRLDDNELNRIGRTAEPKFRIYLPLRFGDKRGAHNKSLTFLHFGATFH